jgi:hypothetical protein
VNNVIPLPTRAVQITLIVTDPEVVHELERHGDGNPREAFALQALRLGVFALRQASGSFDADVIRRERELLVSSVGSVLQERTSDLSKTLEKTVSQYFDASSGLLPQRIEQLIKPNGDLEKLLTTHLGGDNSVIARTLAKHIGDQSPLFKMLSPQQSDGLLATLSSTLQKALDGQREEVLKQFSLDRKDSALSRLVNEVLTSNGKLRGDLAQDIGRVVGEFSLDNENGALSRLVSRVENAQRTITEEFSLDHEGSAFQRLSSMLERTNAAVESSLTLDDEASPLARLRREMFEVFEQQRSANSDFYTDVRSKLEELTTKRAEAARTTLHGTAFEDQVGEILELEAKRVGDIVEEVGTLLGSTQRRRGDFVLEMGVETAARGARIVFEAKSKKRYSMKAALAEIAEARENRKAQVGVFVFDREHAPPKMDPVHRVGNDIFVIWDADDIHSDTYFKAAFCVARTLVTRERSKATATEHDFGALDTLIEEIAKHAVALEGIERAARSIKKNGESILSGAEQLREALDGQVAALQRQVDSLRTAMSDAE